MRCPHLLPFFPCYFEVTPHYLSPALPTTTREPTPPHNRFLIDKSSPRYVSLPPPVLAPSLLKTIALQVPGA